jgi:hypothetical protein
MCCRGSRETRAPHAREATRAGRCPTLARARRSGVNQAARAPAPSCECTPLMSARQVCKPRPASCCARTRACRAPPLTCRAAHVHEGAHAHLAAHPKSSPAQPLSSPSACRVVSSSLPCARAPAAASPFCPASPSARARAVIWRASDHSPPPPRAHDGDSDDGMFAEESGGDMATPPLEGGVEAPSGMPQPAPSACAPSGASPAPPPLPPTPAPAARRSAGLAAAAPEGRRGKADEAGEASCLSRKGPRRTKSSTAASI